MSRLSVHLQSAFNRTLRTQALQHLDDRLSNRIQIVVVERSDANSASTYGIDSKIIFQSFNLFGSKARVGEHSALFGDKAEISHRTFFCKL